MKGELTLGATRCFQLFGAWVVDVDSFASVIGFLAEALESIRS